MMNSEEVANNQKLKEACLNNDFATIHALLVADESLKKLDINQEIAYREQEKAAIHCTLFYAIILNSKNSHIPEISHIIELFKKREDLDLTKTTGRGFTFLHSTLVYGNEDIARWLLEEKGLSLHEKNSYGETALHLAAFYERLEIAQLFLRKPVNLHEKDNDGNTAFHAAMGNDNPDIAELLLKNGANLHEKNNDGETALHLAVKGGNLSLVQFLLRNEANLHEKNIYGETVLHLAVFSGNLDMVEFFLRKSVNLHKKDNGGDTAFHLASLYNNLDIAQLLLKNGANLHEKNNDGETALHLAVKKGNLSIIQFLLKNGANLHEKNNDGETALHLAVKKGNLSIIQLLLKDGANLHETDNKGNTAFHAAVRMNQVDAVQFFLRDYTDLLKEYDYIQTALFVAVESGHVNMAQLLMDKGADIHCENEHGETAIHLAARSGHVNMVQLLMDKGADLRRKDSGGNTVLHFAALNGHVNMAQFLMDNSADIHHENNYGNTALHSAVQEGKLDMVQFLLRKGADIHKRNHDGHNVLHISINEENLSIVKLVVKESNNLSILEEKTRKDITPVQMAVEYDCSEIVNFLMEYGANLEVVDKRGFSLLQRANKYSAFRAAKILLENEVKNYEKLGEITTIFHLAVKYNLIEIVKDFILEKVDINLQNKKGETPFFIAMKENLPQMVEILLENGADKTIQDNENNTPLAIAKSYNNIEVMTVFLEKEVVRQKSQGFRTTLLHLAAKENCLSLVESIIEKDPITIFREDSSGKTTVEVAAAENNLDIVLYLLKKETHIQDKEKLLQYAAAKGYTNTFKCLEKNDANIYSQNVLGHSTIVIAAKSGHISLVSYLIEKKELLEQLVKNSSVIFNILWEENNYSAIQALVKALCSTTTSDINKENFLNAALQSYGNFNTEIEDPMGEDRKHYTIALIEEHQKNLRENVSAEHVGSVMPTLENNKKRKREDLEEDEPRKTKKQKTQSQDSAVTILPFFHEKAFKIPEMIETDNIPDLTDEELKDFMQELEKNQKPELAGMIPEHYQRHYYTNTIRLKTQLWKNIKVIRYSWFSKNNNGEDVLNADIKSAVISLFTDEINHCTDGHLDRVELCVIICKNEFSLTNTLYNMRNAIANKVVQLSTLANPIPSVHTHTRVFTIVNGLGYGVKKNLVDAHPGDANNQALIVSYAKEKFEKEYHPLLVLENSLTDIKEKLKCTGYVGNVELKDEYNQVTVQQWFNLINAFLEAHGNNKDLNFYDFTRYDEEEFKVYDIHWDKIQQYVWQHLSHRLFVLDETVSEVLNLAFDPDFDDVESLDFTCLFIPDSRESIFIKTEERFLTLLCLLNSQSKKDKLLQCYLDFHQVSLEELLLDILPLKINVHVLSFILNKLMEEESHNFPLLVYGILLKQPSSFLDNIGKFPIQVQWDVLKRKTVQGWNLLALVACYQPQQLSSLLGIIENFPLSESVVIIIGDALSIVACYQPQAKDALITYLSHLNLELVISILWHTFLMTEKDSPESLRELFNIIENIPQLYVDGCLDLNYFFAQSLVNKRKYNSHINTLILEYVDKSSVDFQLQFFKDALIRDDEKRDPYILCDFLNILSKTETYFRIKLFSQMTVEEWSVVFEHMASIPEAMVILMNMLGSLPWQTRSEMITAKTTGGMSILLMMTPYVKDLKSVIMMLMRDFKPNLMENIIKDIFLHRNNPEFYRLFPAFAEVIFSLYESECIEILQKCLWNSKNETPESLSAMIDFCKALPTQVQIDIFSKTKPNHENVLMHVIAFDAKKIYQMLSGIQALPEDVQIQIYSQRFSIEPYWSVLSLAIHKDILLLEPLLRAIGALKSKEAIKNILSEKDEEGYDVVHYIESYTLEHNDPSLKNLYNTIMESTEEENNKSPRTPNRHRFFIDLTGDNTKLAVDTEPPCKRRRLSRSSEEK